MTTERLQIDPRLCFNWLPTYRYGQLAYRSLQQACSTRLEKTTRGLSFSNSMIKQISDFSQYCIRPVAMDSVLQTDGHLGYIKWQFENVLEKFDTGEHFFPLTDSIALIVARAGQEKDLINNVVPYMTPAPQTLSASLAVAGGYAGDHADQLNEAHLRRKYAAENLRRELSLAYQCDPKSIVLHGNAVGGIIEATARFLHKNKPGFKTCSLLPEYWDFMRFILTYSPEGFLPVRGRESNQFPAQAWLEGISKPDIDLVYLSYTSNPVGTVIPEDVFLDSLDAVPEDTLFLIDCTSVDIQERSSAHRLRSVIKDFKKKNLLIAKSFSKEYELGDLRIGYALFTRQESADAIWPYMAGYPMENSSNMAIKALKTGTKPVLEHYRRANQLLKEMSQAHAHVRVTGDCSNYTLVYFESAQEATRIKEKLFDHYRSKIYPGEVPMQGGGNAGLSGGETDLASMKNIPFLDPEALRLVVTPQSIPAFEKILAMS